MYVYDFSALILRSMLTLLWFCQVCFPNVQPLIPLFLIHGSSCALFEGYPFCLTFFFLNNSPSPQNAKSTRIFISE